MIKAPLPPKPSHMKQEATKWIFSFGRPDQGLLWSMQSAQIPKMYPLTKTLEGLLHLLKALHRTEVSWMWERLLTSCADRGLDALENGEMSLSVGYECSLSQASLIESLLYIKLRWAPFHAPYSKWSYIYLVSLSEEVWTHRQNSSDSGRWEVHVRTQRETEERDLRRNHSCLALGLRK